MSYLYSRALVEAYLGRSSLDGGASAQSRSNHSADGYFVIDRTTEPSSRSRFGTMSKPLTASHGEAVLTWFQEASRAKTSARRGKEQAFPGSAPDSGVRWRGLSVRFDRDSSSWKTHQCLFPEVLEWSSVTFPRWGMMRAGELWERITSGLPINGTGFGLWPTPRANDAEKRGNINPNNLRNGLPAEVLKFPTPTRMDAAGFCGKPDKGRKGPNSGRTLPGKVLELEGLGPHAETFPTPTRSMVTIEDMDQSRHPANKREPYAKGRGMLNPNWVEWLMNWPTGHTRLGVLKQEKIYDWERRTKTSQEAFFCSGESMRNLWWDKDPSEAPHRPQPFEQCAEQHSDSLRDMPRKNARNREVGGSDDGEELRMVRKGFPVEEAEGHDLLQVVRQQKGVEEKEIIPRVAEGVAHRSHRLKAIGNGQVPAVVATAWRILTEGME